MKRITFILLAIVFVFTNILSAGAVQSKDTAAPTISSSSPASGQQNTGVGISITISFSEAVIKGSNFAKVSLSDGNNKPIPLTLAIKDRTLIATPKSRLAFSTDYKFTVPAGAVKDKSGNGFAKLAVITFKTISSIDSLKEELKAVTYGIGKISVSNPGALETTSPDWIPVVSGDSLTSNTVFAAARKYGYGRILALGKEEILLNDVIYTLDNLLFLKNSMKWLGNGNKRIGYSTGHGEFVDSQSIAKLKKELEKDKFTVRQTKLTDNELKNLDILIIGNAWTSLTTAEMNAVKNFVMSGGGLILAGLGWSFDAYNPGKDYPMDILSSSFGVRWAKPVISDTSEKYQDQPVFTVFYPNVMSLDAALDDAFNCISQKTSGHPKDLMQCLEYDETFRSDYVKAHLLIAKRVQESDRNDIARQKIYDFCKNMIQQYPQYFSKKPVFDMTEYPTITWLRERFINTWISALELNDARKDEIGRIGCFEGNYLDIWKKTGIYIADNNGLDDTQKKVICDTLTSIPSQLHNLQIIAVENLIQPNLTGMSYAGYAVDGSATAYQSLNPGMDLTTTMMEGVKSSICINSIRVPDSSENSFPDAVAPGNVSLFSGVLYHEINHIVDFYTVFGNTSLKARRDELLKTAGDSQSNYLRSMFEDGFFTKNPYEFLSSIANEWFTDSAKTINLGLKYFDATSKNPINQALFFAEIYSAGGSTTCFYSSDPSGDITRTLVPITRDEKGRINSLTINGSVYRFTLDSSGNVTGYTVTK